MPFLNLLDGVLVVAHRFLHGLQQLSLGAIFRTKSAVSDVMACQQTPARKEVRSIRATCAFWPLGR
jgi:hypothetical protein